MRGSDPLPQTDIQRSTGRAPNGKPPVVLATLVAGFQVHEIHAPILGVCRLALTGRFRFLRPETDCLDLSGRHTQQRQSALDCVRTPLTKRKIVLAASSIIAMAFDPQLPILMCEQKLAVRFDQASILLC